MNSVRSVVSAALLAWALATPASAQEERKPERIMDYMAVKLVRGLTNTATCFLELPKQTYKTVSEQGAIGWATGPLKGGGMMLYRGIMGIAETVFFPVPQPGYYDPMVDPPYVWNDWAPAGAAAEPAGEGK